MFMTYLIVDLILLAILIISAILGAKRGLLLSLCSLLSVAIAFAGAIFISNYCAAPVAEWIEPRVSSAVASAVESAIPEQVAGTELTLDNILLTIDNSELPFGLDESLRDYIVQNFPALDTSAITESLTSFLSEKISIAIAYIALFLVSFIVIKLIWKLLSRTLNLVTKLPGLNLINRVGGFLFGTLSVSIVLFVLAWLARMLFSNVIPQSLIEQSYLFRFFMTVNPMNYLSTLPFIPS